MVQITELVTVGKVNVGNVRLPLLVVSEPLIQRSIPSKIGNIERTTARNNGPVPLEFDTALLPKHMPVYFDNKKEYVQFVDFLSVSGIELQVFCLIWL